VALGGEFQVNAYNTASASSPSIAPAPGGGFVVVWRDFASSTGEIHGRRFVASATNVPSLTRGAAVAAALLLLCAAVLALRRAV
jgi:hypothetical protein